MKEIQYEKLTLRSNESETAYTVTDCEKDAVEVTIPKEVDGVPVTGVGENAFKDCDKLCLVNFPENDVDDFIDEKTFRVIGDYAFSGCTSLRFIELPDWTWEIGRGAFCDCAALESAKFSDDAYVYSYAFYHCENLREVTAVRHVNEGVFSHCKSLENFPVASGAKEIGEDAFEHCYALKEIVIPASVKRIEALAFRSCRGLQRVVFEKPEDWYVSFRYAGQKARALDLSNPEKNAEMLSRQDFDDGVIVWYRK